jgi:polysaccharide export outer membrane protein
VLAYYQRYRAFEYYLAPAADNQLFMKVNVWGEVQKPGVLEVPDRTDLLSALSIAGGTKDRAKLSKVKVIRGFNGEKRSWEVNLKKAIKNGNLEQVPVLQPGDTVVVPKSGFNIFSKFLTVAYNVAVIVTASALLLN